MGKDKPKMGRPEIVLTKEQKELAVDMTLAGVNQELIARALGVHKQTLTKKMRDEIDAALAQRKSKGVEHFFTSIKNGSVPAQIFFLKTQCGWKDNSTNEGGDPESKVATPTVNINLKGVRTEDAD